MDWVVRSTEVSKVIYLSNDLTTPLVIVYIYINEKQLWKEGSSDIPFESWMVSGTNFHFLLAFFIFWVSFYPQWILYAFQNACLSSCSSLILASIPFGIDEKRANIVVLLVSSSSQPGLLYEYSTYIRWYTFYIFLDKFKHRRRLYFFSIELVWAIINCFYK